MSVVIGPEEAPWGVLGAFARRRMDFTIDDTNFVLAVANVLWEALRCHAIEAQLRSDEEQLRLAARTAGFGSYFADVETGSVSWSAELRAIIGLEPDAPVDVSIGEVPAFIHADDRGRVAAELGASLDPAGDGDFQDEHRIVRPDGEIRWVLMRDRTVFRREGTERRPAQLAGVVLDITERHRFFGPTRRCCGRSCSIWWATR